MTSKNIMIVGVGGQGTLLTSRILGKLAINAGYDVKLSEVHGMAQRGGSVVSHVRIGEKIYSPLIPHGGADVIIGFEPAEAVRCLPYLKKGGCVVVSPAPIRPVTASLTGGAYTGREMMEYLEHAGENLVVVDAASIGMECGSPKVMNVALLGAAIASGLIGISLEEMEAAIEKRVPEKFKDMNMKALKLGAAASAMIR